MSSPGKWLEDQSLVSFKTKHQKTYLHWQDRRESLYDMVMRENLDGVGSNYLSAYLANS